MTSHPEPEQSEPHVSTPAVMERKRDKAKRFAAEGAALVG